MSICAVFWHNVGLSLHHELKTQMIMNTDNAISVLSSMLSSEDSFSTLMDMINDMDLELRDINLL